MTDQPVALSPDRIRATPEGAGFGDGEARPLRGNRDLVVGRKP
jgi:hypothetical protein